MEDENASNFNTMLETKENEIIVESLKVRTQLINSYIKRLI